MEAREWSYDPAEEESRPPQPWWWRAPSRLVIGAVAGGVLVTLAGQVTAFLGATACLICDPLLAAPTGAIMGGIALWRLGTEDY